MPINDSINPELAEASPWLQDAVSASNAMMDSGIDPGLALAAAAAVPVVLRGLKLLGQFTDAMAEDFREANKIKREKQRMEMQRDFEAPAGHPSGRPPP